MKTFFFVLSIFLFNAVQAQDAVRYSLQQCIDTALKNNIGVRQSGLLAESADVARQQSRANLLPDFAFNLNHGLNKGRSIDPFTNSFVDQNIFFAGYGASSGAVLFNGGALRNNIRQNTRLFEAARWDQQQIKDNLWLSVLLAYLQVLTTQELIVAASNQKELSAKQLERLEVLDKQGAIAPAQVSDVRGQFYNDELNLINLRNTLELAKLSLTQLMNIPYRKDFAVEDIKTPGTALFNSQSMEATYERAVQRFAQLKAAELRQQSAAYGLKAAKGLRYPQLSFGGGAQTNYSSIAANSTGKIRYPDQLGNNLFYTLNMGLRIPILNALQTRNNIKLAKIEVRNSNLLEEAAKLQLRQQVEQAHLNMIAAYDRYTALSKQVDAFTVSFRAVEARFTAGVGNSVDYLIAKNNMDRATINYIAAGYDFILRNQVLEFLQSGAGVKQ